jgi:polysaccharide pyruvyl transferase WcaK-like protein
VIFALTTGAPLIAISYHPKTIDFMKQYSLEANLIKETELSLDLFIKVFNRLIINIDEIGISQFEKSRKISKIISEDFKRILESNI